MTTAERMFNLFRGLDRSHGTYDVPEGTQPDSEGKLRGNAVTVATGPSVELWQAHLDGTRSLGVVPICSDSSCVFGALDVDSYQDFDIAVLLEKSSNGLNLPLVICRSKSGGAHLFLFAAEPVAAKLMRARLAECRDALSLPKKTEIFPKHDEPTEKGAGWLNMPYLGTESDYGGRYSVMPYGVCQTPEEFLDYVENGKLEASWFAKPVAYMQAAGTAKKKQKQAKPEPAYKHGLKDAHYPELQSALAYYIGINGPPKRLSDGEIDLRILSMLDTAGITDLAKRKEYIQELAPYGRKIRDEDQTQEPKKKDLLQKLCEDFNCFNAGAMADGFVQFTRGDHKEVWPVERIEKLLRIRYLALTGGAPKREEMALCMDTLAARCMDGPRQQIHSRIARSQDKIYLDLCDEKWQAVEIDAAGWRVVSNPCDQHPPIYFNRSNEAKELPTPVSGGSLEELRPLLNAGDDDQWILMMGWLIGIFQPEGPFSHIAIEGPEGSAKTTTSINLISIVDPNSVGLAGPPRNEQDFSLIAMSAGVLGFDNFSGCKESLSDLFCKASTGMGFRTRTLYKNREVTSISLKIPLLFNGIDSVVMRGDLLRRTIVLHLPVIEKDTRKTDKALAQKYREVHPRILGALLDAVACGLTNLAITTVTNAPSMADFAQWVKACEPALPWQPGMFLGAYHNMQQGASEDLFDKDQFATALYEWVMPQIQKGVDDISSRALLAALNKPIRVEPGKISPVDMKVWPTLRTINDAIERVRPLLLKKELRVERTKRTSKTKGMWHFESTNRQLELVKKAA